MVVQPEAPTINESELMQSQSPPLVRPIVAQIGERKAKLELYWAEYNDMQSRLESLDEFEGCDRDDFEEAFYALSDRIRELISPSSTLRASIFSPSSSNIRESDSNTHIRLLKLNLSTFFQQV